MSSDVLAVIVTHNSSHVVGALLDSLPEAADGVSIDVIVIDNDSVDETRELLAARDDCTVIARGNDGYAAAINYGIQERPQAPVILVLNPDVRLHPGSIRNMVEALAQPGRGIVVPRVLDSEEQLTWSLRREPTLLRAVGLTRWRWPRFSEYCNRPEDYERGHVVDWAVGAVLVMSRECYEAVGEWDESYFLYSEETEFMLRARDLGYRTWYEPTATATHIGKQSGYSGFTHSMLAINRVRLYRRRHGAAASWLYFALTLLVEASWLVRGQQESRDAIVALLSPRRRPPQLHCSEHLLPT